MNKKSNDKKINTAMTQQLTVNAIICKENLMEKVFYWLMNVDKNEIKVIFNRTCH